MDSANKPAIFSCFDQNVLTGFYGLFGIAIERNRHGRVLELYGRHMNNVSPQDQCFVFTFNEIQGMPRSMPSGCFDPDPRNQVAVSIKSLKLAGSDVRSKSRFGGCESALGSLPYTKALFNGKKVLCSKGKVESIPRSTSPCSRRSSACGYPLLPQWNAP